MMKLSETYCLSCKNAIDRKPQENEVCWNCAAIGGAANYKPKPITNADRIRAMVDDIDLAIFLDSVKTDGRLNDDNYPYSKFGWLDWLRQEEDDGNERCLGR